MIHSFPYEWADTLDTEALEPCTVYGPPAAASPEVTPDLRSCLDKPIGTPALADQLRGVAKVLVLVDDMTRDTPQRRLLPGVLDYLADAGVAPEATTILIATGMHRGMSEAEIHRRFGSTVSKRYRVVNHCASETGSLTPAGTSPEGTPILVNRLVHEHDLILAVGQIGPHRVAGFSGGAKMVLPGICGEEITTAVHWRGWLHEGEEIYGVADNPMRKDMEVVAQRVGLRFIVNVVLSPDGGIHGIYAGDPRAAFRRGAEASRRMLSVPVAAADIVIVDSHPYDIDFWQACKAISVAELVVKRGGVIILVTPCPEGLSAHASRIERIGYLHASEIVRRVNDGSIADRLIACHLMAVGRILERGRLIVVSPGLPPEFLSGVGMQGSPDIRQAVAAARKRMGAGASIAVLRSGCKMIPVGTRSTAD